MKIGNRNGAVERLALSRSNMDAPVEFQTLAETLEPKFRETFACHFNGLSKSQPSGLVMPPEFFRLIIICKENYVGKCNFFFKIVLRQVRRFASQFPAETGRHLDRHFSQVR